MNAAVFSLATDAVPGRPGEDFALATTDLAVVVDGTAPADLEGACSHGAAWFARQLGTHVLAALADEPALPLPDGLARAVRAVSRLHVYTCDLAPEKAPSAAIGVLRLTHDTIDALAVGTCVVVVDTPAGPQLTGEVGGPDGEPPSRSVGADQSVAHHALTNSYPRAWARRLALLTDGAAWPVGAVPSGATGGPLGWADYLDLLDKVGPATLLAHIRSWARATAAPVAPSGTVVPAGPGRERSADDATVVHALALPRT